MDLTDTETKEDQQIPNHPRALITGRGVKFPSSSNIVSKKPKAPEPSGAIDTKSSVTTGNDQRPSVPAQRRQLKARRGLTPRQASAGAQGRRANSGCIFCADEARLQEEVAEGQTEPGLRRKQASYVLRELRRETLHAEEVGALPSQGGNLAETAPAPPLHGLVEGGSSQLGPNRLQPIASTGPPAVVGRPAWELGAGSGPPTPRDPLKSPLPVTAPRNGGWVERALEGPAIPSEEGEGQRNPIDPEALRRLQKSLLQEEEEEEDGDMCRICKCAGVLQFVNPHYLKDKATSGEDHRPSVLVQRQLLQARRSPAPRQATAGAQHRRANSGCCCCAGEAEQQREQEGTVGGREFRETSSTAALRRQQTDHVLQKLRNERLRRSEASPLQAGRRVLSEMPPAPLLFSPDTQTTTLSHHCWVDAESGRPAAIPAMGPDHLQPAASSWHGGTTGKARGKPGTGNNPPTTRDPLQVLLPMRVPWSQRLGEPVPEQPTPSSEQGEHQRALADPEEVQRSLLQEAEEDKEEGDMCRICLVPGGTPLNPLLEPCKCVGSLQFVHQDCLKEWLKAKVISAGGGTDYRGAAAASGSLADELNEYFTSTFAPEYGNSLSELQARQRTGAELAAVTSCELCQHALKLDFDNFDVNAFYRQQAACQVEEQASDSNLLATLLLHFYDQRFSELLRVLDGNTTAHQVESLIQTGQFTTVNSQPEGDSANTQNSDSEEADW